MNIYDGKIGSNQIVFFGRIEEYRFKKKQIGFATGRRSEFIIKLFIGKNKSAAQQFYPLTFFFEL